MPVKAKSVNQKWLPAAEDGTLQKVASNASAA